MRGFLKRIFLLASPRTHLNRSLRILITTNAIFVFILGLFAPFYAVFVAHIGGSIAFAGLSWAVLMIVSGILVLLFTNLELRVTEQKVLIALGYILRAAVFLSYAFMSSMTQLLATQILWGVATAVGSPAFDAVYAAHTTKESSISQWAGWEGVSSIVTGIAALAGGLIIQSFGYQAIFLMMATVSLLLGIYLLRLPHGEL